MVFNVLLHVDKFIICFAACYAGESERNSAVRGKRERQNGKVEMFEVFTVIKGQNVMCWYEDVDDFVMGR